MCLNVCKCACLWVCVCEMPAWDFTGRPPGDLDVQVHSGGIYLWPGAQEKNHGFEGLSGSWGSDRIFVSEMTLAVWRRAGKTLH